MWGWVYCVLYRMDFVFFRFIDWGVICKVGVEEFGVGFGWRCL